MTVSIMKSWKDKDGITHYKLYKNVGSINVNGEEINFESDN